MAQLQVRLDGLAQLVAAHAGHHDVGDDQVGNLVLHALQGGGAVEVHGHVVVRAQEHLHVVGDVDVVVHDGDPLAVLAVRRLRRHFRGDRGGDVVHRLDFRALVLGVGGGAHGKYEAEDQRGSPP